MRRRAKVADFEAPLLVIGDRTVAIAAPVVTIGRDEDNDVVIDEPSVSRHHARLLRSPSSGFSVEDLGSTNGTSVGSQTLYGGAAYLSDHSTIYIGDVQARFEQPRSVAIGGKTVFRGVEHTILRNAAPAGETTDAATATEPLSARPRQRSGWAVKRIPDERGLQRWVLRNTRNGRYLELDERDLFVWEQIDGENTVRDMLYAFAQKFGELALPRIENNLRTFAAAELIRGGPGQLDEPRKSLLGRIGKAMFNALLKLEISISGIDGLIDKLYRRFGWRFFTRTGVFLLWVLIGAGLFGFWHAREHHRLFDLGGAGVWGVVAVAVVFLGTLTIHETTHALAVKSYGRRLTRGGFLLMMGMPYAFVDTSDMWFGTRWSRIVVTLSGPLSTAGIAGIYALIAAYVSNPIVAGVAYQLAFGLYLNTLYNFNPLMPLDGYQALSDALRIPRLREDATAYALGGLWRDIGRRRRPGLREIGLTVYGFAAVVATYLFLAMGILAWRTRLGPIVHRHFRAPFDTIVIVTTVGLVMFPVWLRFARTAMKNGKRLRRRATMTVSEPADVPT